MLTQYLAFNTAEIPAPVLFVGCCVIVIVMVIGTICIFVDHIKERKRDNGN